MNSEALKGGTSGEHFHTKVVQIVGDVDALKRYAIHKCIVTVHLNGVRKVNYSERITVHEYALAKNVYGSGDGDLGDFRASAEYVRADLLTEILVKNNGLEVLTVCEDI